MEPQKPLNPDCFVATEQQQPQDGLEEAASTRDVATPKKSSTPSRTSTSSRASKSSRTSTSSRISVSSRASTSSRISVSSRASTSSRTSRASRISRKSTQQCMILMAETYPPRQEVRRTGVPKVDKAIQTPHSFDASLNKRHTRLKKKTKRKDVISNQNQLRASRDSSTMEIFPQAVENRTPSLPKVTSQHRKSKVISNTCVDPDEEGWEDQDVLEVEGDEADVHSPGTDMENSQGICPAKETQEGLKHTQAHSEHGGTALTQTRYQADVHNPGTAMEDSQGICPAEKETQEGLKHTQAHSEHGGTALTQTLGKEVKRIPHLEAGGSFHKEGKQVDEGELKSHPAPIGMHLVDVDRQQALRDVSVEGDAANSQDPNSSVGTGEVILYKEELQQIARHAAGGRVFRDSQDADPAKELDPAAVNGDEENIQDLESILDPTASKVHPSSQGIHEALRHVEAVKRNLSKSTKAAKKVQQTPLGEEDKDDVSSEGSILAALNIHSALEELNEAQMDEKAALAPGHVPQTHVGKKLPRKKKVLNPLEIDTAIELPETPQTRVESETVKNMTKQQQKDSPALLHQPFRGRCIDTGSKEQPPQIPVDYSSLFPKEHKTDLDGNINLQHLEVLAKQLGISFDGQETQKKLVCADADGDKAMNYSDFLTAITDQNCFIQTVFPDQNDSDNVNHVDAREVLLLKVLLKLVELEALPPRTLFQISSYYKQKFEDCAGEEAWTHADFLVSHKKNNNKNTKVLVCPLPLANLARITMMKEKEATAYLEQLKDHMPDPNSPYAEVPVFPLISKQDANTLVKPKKDMQKQTMQRKKQPVASKAAAKASAQNSKKKCSSGNNSEHPNKQRRPPRASDPQAAQRYRNNLVLRKHASLLKLWQKIHGAQIGRQSGSRRFYHTFSTYSWSWNACRELVTAEELQAHDWYCRFLPATRQPPWKKWMF
ncbi:EF-hand calcium-binding domain-containing protein 3 isoform X3 [Coturnix japonica]|uniref:EF-hand calcium-binding domain-containing protein 3 isoform X3 n=1 Tax=Coturnix japonica TaxID=93934 RepID=UPI0013A5C762|nr:EF-hand calcium-binding domain-containing protein 3 isoform X3 [Coturnix japonica]